MRGCCLQYAADIQKRLFDRLEGQFMFAVRQYKDSDLGGVLSAWENASRIAHPFLSEEFQALVRKDIPDLYMPNADTWVVETDKQVIGFIALIGNEVGAIFLQPEHQGKKLGKSMMDKAQELHGDLEVEVFKKNSIGRAFYEQYGFRLIEEKIHEQTGEPLFRLKFSAKKSKLMDDASSADI
jgi:putative acetyltransferase